jgi:phage gpG-like protein
VSGVEEVIQRLLQLRDRGVELTTVGARAMGTVMERQVVTELGRASHARNAATTAAPGSPPAMVTGALRRSVKTVEVAPGHVEVGATTAYARIQELGGTAGRGGATTLPARPYLRPAYDAAILEARLAALTVISEMLLS